MKTTSATTLAALMLALAPSSGSAQAIRNGDNNNNLFQQVRGDLSVRDVTFNFLGGNDRLILLRNDDLAGLNRGVANMGGGRDVVITSFNMSGTFNLGPGNDFFLSEGEVGFNANAIVVLAGSGDDLILVTTDLCSYAGEAGNDLFVSDGSRNRFDGGEGSDTYSAEAAESGAEIDLAQGVAIARFTTGESLISIENARGSASDDVIFGDSGANRLDGLEGDDSIDGDPGNDTISGGAGTNNLFGNAGTDTLVVQGVVTSKTRLSANSIRVTGALNGVPFTHTATDFEQVSANNVLQSVAFFLGETATNTVAPTFIPETPVQAAVNGFVAGLTLNGTTAADTLTGAAGHDDIVGFGGNDTLIGNAGDDILLGGAGADRLSGGDGNDILDGGQGSDTLTGGTGNDFFDFSASLNSGADTITDYDVARDTIRIKAGLIGNLPAGRLPAANFKVIAAANGALDANDRIIYTRSTGQLHFDSNGSAAGGRTLIAKLPANLTMTAAEIFIFR
jgi:Ca2+-binding RTX toxin-like protein